jgi:predicted NAD/FAD-dependent oxidoreductase
MAFLRHLRVAVIGAGLAGASCAQSLALAGHSVQVFDKSRGAGGRLASRLLDWTDRSGQDHTTRFDHGALGITARSTAFAAFVAQAVDAGWVSGWTPTLASGSLPLEDGEPLFVPVPDMPTLCRRLLTGVECTWSFPVDRLHRGPLGWRVQAGDTTHPALFDAVLLALPPAQAAPLLGAHQPGWARLASVVPMQPCWTLMGIADEPAEAGAAGGWDLARPPGGALAWVLRSDMRPGRARVAGQAHWVVHARTGFSRQHLEQPAAWVQQQLQDALAEWLGRPVDWMHSVAHRWRYALPQPHPRAAAPAAAFWWDASQGLGVCGDVLGGMGIEGAWLSGHALSAALLRHAAAAPTAAPLHDPFPPLVV